MIRGEIAALQVGQQHTVLVLQFLHFPAQLSHLEPRQPQFLLRGRRVGADEHGPVLDRVAVVQQPVRQRHQRLGGQRGRRRREFGFVAVDLIHQQFVLLLHLDQRPPQQLGLLLHKLQVPLELHDVFGRGSSAKHHGSPKPGPWTNARKFLVAV